MIDFFNAFAAWTGTPDFAAHHFATLVIAGLVGGLVRGYSGFGFALAAVPILALVVPPAVAVPTVVLMELVIGGVTLPSVHASIHRPTFLALAAGSLAGTPLGLLFLRSLPAEPMRIVVAGMVLVSVVLIALSSRRKRANARGPVIAAAGFVSGLMNGGTAMSGPPAILIVLGSNLDGRMARATLIVFLLFSGVLAFAISAGFGLVGAVTFTNAAIMALPVAAGTFTGTRLFAVMPEAHYRQVSLAILTVVACVTLASALTGG